MIKIAICDDIVETVNWMKKAIENHRYRDEILVDTFVNGWELYESAARERYDIILLDIELVPGKEDENGMQVSAKIKAAYPETLIIFFTGKMGYESALLNFEPFRYIQKPIEEKEILSAVKDAIDRIKGWEDKYITFKYDFFTYGVNLSDILYIFSRSPYIEVRSLHETFEVREKLDDVEKRIRELTLNFVRVNKSYLVNRKFIKKHSNKSVILTNDECIQISRKYSDEVGKILKSKKNV